MPAWIKKEHTSQGLSKEGSYQVPVPSIKFKVDEKKVVHKGSKRGGWDDDEKEEKIVKNVPEIKHINQEITKPNKLEEKPCHKICKDIEA